MLPLLPGLSFLMLLNRSCLLSFLSELFVVSVGNTVWDWRYTLGAESLTEFKVQWECMRSSGEMTDI